jgi:multidrug efflux pump
VRLSEIAIERPVLAIVLSLIITLMGAISVLRLPNRELPDIDPPVVSVVTVLPGAAPEVVETSVTQVLEDELIGIEGIRHMTSVSREQSARISIEFELSRDVNEAANDVRDRAARAQRDLPEEADSPIVSRSDADASPIMWVALSSSNRSQIEISTIAERDVRDRLGKLPGVAKVILGGERRLSIRVWIDNRRLTAHSLTVSDVVAALERENVDLPSGRVEGADREFTVRTLGELVNPEQYADLTIAEISGSPIRLRDVARVEIGPEDDRKLVRFNRVPSIALGIVKQSKANTLSVATAVRSEIAALQKELPPGVTMQRAFDSSIFVKRSIEDVRDTIFQAVVLVLFVIYLFLRSARATLIPAISIPVSIVGTFAVLYFLDFSINTLTLMGLTLAIGLVVDDSIVVLENITRRLEEGLPRHEAARQGMNEISFAVVTATVSVVAVFMPLAFLTDKTGRLFREFGVTVAAAVAISGFVALTLSPSLCARVLRPSQEEKGIRAKLESGFEALAAGYNRLLTPAVRAHGRTVGAGVAWVALGIVLLQFVPREFVPYADRANLMIFTRAPEGSTIEYTGRYQKQAEEMVLDMPEISKAFSVVALGIGTPGLVNEGAFFTTLTPWEERERSQQEVAEDLRERLWEIPGISAFPLNPSPLAQSLRSYPVSVVLQGPDAANLAGYAEEIVGRGNEIPGLINLRTDLLLNKPQIDVHIDRDRANDLGVSVRDASTTLQILLGGLDVTTFKREGETYDVIVQLDRPARATPRSLLGLYAHGTGGQIVPLVSFVELRESTAPRALPHFDRQRSATVTGSVQSGYALGDVLEQISALAEEVLPATGGYSFTFSGESEDFFESSNAIIFAYALALLIIFLVLAAQFESFLHPLTILIAVALSFTGALVALVATGHTLNLFSQIGLVMLVGLVTKNSILIVEFANQLRERGASVVDAAHEAARTRFRPILMTAISTIVGILPIALGLGAGGESRAGLGVAVVGGMLFSTLLTLFIVPAAYILLDQIATLTRDRMRSMRGELPSGRVESVPGKPHDL